MYKLILMIVLGVLSNNITAQETNILKEHQSELMLQWSASLTPKDRKIAFTQFIDIFQIVKPNPNVEIESFIKQSESGDSQVGRNKSFRAQARTSVSGTLHDIAGISYAGRGLQLRYSVLSCMN